jgi:branched-subunit amino acid aminotransferase/4-amino-4-deoxychorismate lyase
LALYSLAHQEFVDSALVPKGLKVLKIDGLLPGVCRAALLEAARELGMTVESRPVALAELVDAAGVLLTSSPRGLSEVAELDHRALRRMPADLLSALREGVEAAARTHALALP